MSEDTTNGRKQQYLQYLRLLDSISCKQGHKVMNLIYSLDKWPIRNYVNTDNFVVRKAEQLSDCLKVSIPLYPVT